MSISTWDAVRVQQKAAQHDRRDLAGERARDAATVERIYQQMPHDAAAAFSPDDVSAMRASVADEESWWNQILAAGPEGAPDEEDAE